MMAVSSSSSISSISTNNTFESEPAAQRPAQLPAGSLTATASTASATTITTTTTVRFFTPEKTAHLHERGYVVIPGVVADPAFCRSLRDALFAQSSHPDPTVKPTAPTTPSHGIDRLWPHTQALWDARQHHDVAACFAEYWRCDPADLLVSFDGSNTFRAEEYEGAESIFWAHTDQGRPDRGKEPLDGRCLQGFLNLEDCDGDNDGGLVVWSGGHRAWEGYYRVHDRETGRGNFYRYPREYIQEIQIDGRQYLDDADPAKTADRPFPMPRVRVRAKAGDMVFCFLTAEDATKRATAFAENRMTSHWPAGGQVKLFPSFRESKQVKDGSWKRRWRE
ncbi:hypothetical protein DFJ73DRAFT_793781 [Zopfochytrium polystomum]|nr:hypothetical protein DFJ73DRAFT_793781 [Zopfochytrium polystomum]